MNTKLNNRSMERAGLARHVDTTWPQTVLMERRSVPRLEPTEQHKREPINWAACFWLAFAISLTLSALAYKFTVGV